MHDTFLHFKEEKNIKLQPILYDIDYQRRSSFEKKGLKPKNLKNIIKN